MARLRFTGRKRGPKPHPVIGITDDGAVRHWRNIFDAAAELGTTTATLRVYMSEDMSYKGFYLDLEAPRQLKLF